MNPARRPSKRAAGSLNGLTRETDYYAALEKMHALCDRENVPFWYAMIEAIELWIDKEGSGDGDSVGDCEVSGIGTPGVDSQSICRVPTPPGYKGLGRRRLEDVSERIRIANAQREG